MLGKKKTQPISPAAELAVLLKSADPAQQLANLKKIFNQYKALQQPVITVVIQHDLRNNTWEWGDMSGLLQAPGALAGFLAAAQQGIIQQQMAAVQAATPPVPPAEATT